jgi:hypothetical protein
MLFGKNHFGGNVMALFQVFHKIDRLFRVAGF